MAGLGHEKFEAALKVSAEVVDGVTTQLAEVRGDLKRIARAAHAAGMTERDIAKATGRSGPAVHAWLHAEDA
jgi:hypothetical protein